MFEEQTPRRRENDPSADGTGSGRGSEKEAPQSTPTFRANEPEAPSPASSPTETSPSEPTWTEASRRGHPVQPSETEASQRGHPVQPTWMEASRRDHPVQPSETEASRGAHPAEPPSSPPYNPNDFDLLGDVIQAPDKAFAYLASPGAERAGLAIFVYILAQIPFNWHTAPFGLGDADLVVRLLANAVASVLQLLVAAGILHLAARLLGGRNRYSKLFQSLGIASLPGLLGAPLIAWSLATAARGAVPTAINWGIQIWMLVLQVLAIRHVYKFSTARAIGTIFLPPILIAVLATLLIVAAIMLGVEFMPLIDDLGL